MSLINDALRRAKQAQRQAPTPAGSSGLQFRPVEPEVKSPSQSNLFMPGVLVLVAIVVAVLMAQLGRKSESETTLPSRARADSPAAVAPPAEPLAQSPPAISPDAPVTTAGIQNEARMARAPDRNTSAAQPEGQTSVVSGSGVTSSNGSPPAMAAPVTNATPSAPPPKLQGIVWNPKRPSAVINGRTLFIGDRFGDFRVRSITADTLTLVGQGQTNVFVLEQ